MSSSFFFEDGYGWEYRDGCYRFRVVRAGAPRSHPARGGTWYQVELYPGFRSSYLKGPLAGGLPGVGGEKVHRCVISLHRPYFWRIPAVRAEGEISIRLWEDVTGKRLRSRRGFYGARAEKRYAKLEREVAELLAAEGYDGVVLYYQPGGPWTRYPAQVFVFTDEHG